MAYALKVAKTKILLTLPSSLTVALAAAKAVGLSKKNVLLLEGKVKGFKSIQDLIEDGLKKHSEPAYRIPRGKTNQQICGYLNFSSGTTGLPKAVSVSLMHAVFEAYASRSCCLTTTSWVNVCN